MTLSTSFKPRIPRQMVKFIINVHILVQVFFVIIARIIWIGWSRTRVAHAQAENLLFISNFLQAEACLWFVYAYWLNSNYETNLWIFIYVFFREFKIKGVSFNLYLVLEENLNSTSINSFAYLHLFIWIHLICFWWAESKFWK